jgi:hypothetical protein
MFYGRPHLLEPFPNFLRGARNVRSYVLDLRV